MKDYLKWIENYKVNALTMLNLGIIKDPLSTTLKSHLLNKGGEFQALLIQKSQITLNLSIENKK